jgi:calcineurin-like phosphoesterase family protein
MIETWFTSDLHLGHKNILLYEALHRPFKTVEEMNERLISNWNSVVGAKDIVYVLGDFAFGKHNIQLAERLAGKKRLVLGNHDTYHAAAYLEYFDKLYGMCYWDKCILSHMPVHMYNTHVHLQSYDIAAPLFLNVHGHLHSKNVKTVIFEDTGAELIIDDENYFNVSVEQHNLTPVNADIIRAKANDIC